MRVILVDPLLRDAFFATIMNGSLLWICGRILRLQPRWGWMMTAAVLGGVYQFSLGIRWQLGYVSGIEWIVFLAVGGFIAWLSSPKLNFLQALRRIFLFYLLTFLSVGVSMGASSLIQLAGGGRLSSWLYFLINMISLMIVAELGWGMIREAVWTRSHLVKLFVHLKESEFYLQGLVDTGNMLRDPLTQIPVVILSLPAVRSFLPETVAQLIEQVMAGDIPNQDVEEYWQTRIEILPFRAVGNTCGLLAGLKIEQLEVIAPSHLIIKPAMLGFTGENFSTGDYQAIVPAALFERALSL